MELRDTTEDEIRRPNQTTLNILNIKMNKFFYQNKEMLQWPKIRSKILDNSELRSANKRLSNFEDRTCCDSTIEEKEEVSREL